MIDDSTLPADTPDPRSPIGAGTVATRYPPDVLSLAFQIWLWRAGRQISRTHVLLEIECRALEAPVPDVRTIERWAQRDQWDIRGNALIAQLAPGMDERDAAALYVLRREAIDAAGRLVRGEVPVEQAPSLVKAVQVAAMMTGLVDRVTRPVLSKPRDHPRDDRASDESPADTMLRLLHASR